MINTGFAQLTGFSSGQAQLVLPDNPFRRCAWLNVFTSGKSPPANGTLLGGFGSSGITGMGLDGSFQLRQGDTLPIAIQDRESIWAFGISGSVMQFVEEMETPRPEASNTMNFATVLIRTLANLGPTRIVSASPFRTRISLFTPHQNVWVGPTNLVRENNGFLLPQNQQVVFNYAGQLWGVASVVGDFTTLSKLTYAEEVILSPPPF